MNQYLHKKTFCLSNNPILQRKTFCLTFSILCLASFSNVAEAIQSKTSDFSYVIVDTNQTQCSDSANLLSKCPQSGEVGFGQDAQYQANPPSYTNNQNGTVSDNNTGLMWVQTIDTNGDGQITASDKMTYQQAVSYVSQLQLAGYSDWRLASIKELYSLILFDGEDPSGVKGKGTFSIRPYIDLQYFAFNSGDTNAGERLIDAQYLSSTKYVSTTMQGDETVFGVNFIDGRIKGYGMTNPRGIEKTFYIQAVRGNSDYGINKFSTNNKATVLDQATGLTWQQTDSGKGMDWPAALDYCENLELVGNNNWRLPNIKELHSIVDYTKSPQTSNSAAIDGRFNTSSIINEGGEKDYPNYWSSTTHINLKNGKNAAYVSFGRSLGNMRNNWIDVHGAGAQRSDPKVDNGQDYPQGHGPQGDAIRFENYVRCVTDNNTQFVQNPTAINRDKKQYQLDESTMSKPISTNSNSNKKMNNGRNKGKQDPFAQLDKNKDNKLSRDEVKGPLKSDFDRLDLNNDGYLSKNELPQRP